MCSSLGEDVVSGADDDGSEPLGDPLVGNDVEQAKVGTVGSRPDKAPGFRPVEPHALGVAVCTRHHWVEFHMAERLVDGGSNSSDVVTGRAGGAAGQVLDVSEETCPLVRFDQCSVKFHDNHFM